MELSRRELLLGTLGTLGGAARVVPLLNHGNDATGTGMASP